MKHVTLTGGKQATCVVINNKYPRYSKFNKSRKPASWTCEVTERNVWLKKYCTGGTVTYKAICICARPQNWQTNLRQDSTANYIYILLQKAKMSKYDNKPVKKTLKLYTSLYFDFSLTGQFSAVLRYWLGDRPGPVQVNCWEPLRQNFLQAKYLMLFLSRN